MDRPGKDEYARFYETYIKLVPEPELLKALQASEAELQKNLESITPSISTYRYLPEKWSVFDVIRHCADTERVFGFRALWIARGDERPIPGFDERLYARTAAEQSLDIQAAMQELALIRSSNILLFRSFSKEALLKRGVANGSPVTVRAIGYMLIGHWRHHWKVLLERYGLNPAPERSK